MTTRGACAIGHLSAIALAAIAAVALLAAGCSRTPLDDAMADAGGAIGTGGVSGDDAGAACPSGGPAGAPVVQILSFGTPQTESNGIAVRDGRVYWATVDWLSDAGASGYGYLQAMDTSDGGEPVVLGAAVLPYAVAVDEANVYWTIIGGASSGAGSGPELLMTPRGGGPTTVLASGLPETPPIAVGPTDLYWLDPGGVQSGSVLMRMPLGGGGGGAPATVLSTPPGSPILCFTVDANNLYWVQRAANSSDAALQAMPLGGGTQLTLAGVTDCTSLAVGSSYAAWADDDSVHAVPLAGGSPSTIFSDPTNIVSPVAIDCGYVYWATGNEVLKAPLAGGTPTSLAPLVQGWGTATGLALDATSLYFATNSACGSGEACAFVEKVTPK